MTPDGDTLLFLSVMYRRLEIYKFLINEGAKIDASWTHCDVMAYGLGTELDPAPEDEAAQLLDAMQGQPWDRDFEYLVGFLWVGGGEPSLETLTRLYRHGFLEDITGFLEVYLHWFTNPTDLRKYLGVPDKDPKQVVREMEWFVSVEANPHTNVHHDAGLLHHATLSGLALRIGELSAWLKILRRYNVGRALHDAYQGFSSRATPEDFAGPQMSVLHRALLVLYAHLFEAAFQVGFDYREFERIVLLRDIPEWSDASSTDVEHPLPARITGATDGTLKLRQPRRFVGD